MICWNLNSGSDKKQDKLKSISAKYVYVCEKKSEQKNRKHITYQAMQKNQLWDEELYGAQFVRLRMTYIYSMCTLTTHSIQLLPGKIWAKKKRKNTPHVKSIGCCSSQNTIMYGKDCDTVLCKVHAFNKIN